MRLPILPGNLGAEGELNSSCKMEHPAPKSQQSFLLNITESLTDSCKDDPRGRIGQPSVGEADRFYLSERGPCYAVAR